MVVFNTSFYKKARTIKLLAGLMAVSSWAVQADSLSNDIKQLIEDPKALSAGKQTFEMVCAACHAKDLSGGTGFNLKDEEWIHGDKPAEIYHNVFNGFIDQGMPGFGAIYQPQQLKQVVAYVLSNRQGLANLQYRIYPVTTEEKQSDYHLPVNAKPAKSGPVPNNLIDFALPEIQNFVLEFEGTLYTPTDVSRLHATTNYKHRTELFIDGEKVPMDMHHWQKRVWTLKPGKQKFLLRYYRIGQAKNLNKKVNFFVTNESMTQKLYGISVSGKQFLSNATIPLKADQHARLVRKKVVDLPTFSISVGLPKQVNYAFNTRTCSIVGMWTGDFINVGPNVEGRARDGSVILGDWVFKNPQVISPIAETRCRFEQYHVNEKAPEFIFWHDNTKLKMRATGENGNSLTLNYQVISGDLNRLTKWQLPKGDNFNVNVQGGSMNNQALILDKNSQQWQIKISKKAN